MCTRQSFTYGGVDFERNLGFRLTFKIERKNAKVQREAHFLSGLADTVENNLASYDACRHAPANFARRYDIRSQTKPRQCRQNSGIGIGLDREGDQRSEEHTSELQSLIRISYAVFCLKKKIQSNLNNTNTASNN